MKLIVNEDAAKWYKSELALQDGDYLRFFVRYGGCSTVQKGFSLGVENEIPLDPGPKTIVAGITFYIEEKDLWYYDEHDLEVSLNTQYNEPEFNYQKDETK